MRGERGRLATLYLGGGTPSRLGGQGIGELISLVRERFTVEGDAEVTIEANPDDVTPKHASDWKAAGINRVSLGVQSFDDSVLQWMHRVHDASAAARSFEILREAGFDNISVDLIFALPESLNRSWRRDLETAIAIGPDHISLYGLTVEPSTPLARWTERGVVTPSGEQRYADEFLLADSFAKAAGYDHYEVSNFALAGKRSRHNSAYWSGARYIGIGPSAHSFDGERRTWNTAAYADWIARLSRGESVAAGGETLTSENRIVERVYLGLRTKDGLPLSESDRTSADRWQREGWATVDRDVMRLTTEGWLRLDSIAAALTAL